MGASHEANSLRPWPPPRHSPPQGLHKSPVLGRVEWGIDWPLRWVVGQESQGRGSHWKLDLFLIAGAGGGPQEKKLSFMLRLGNPTLLSLCAGLGDQPLARAEWPCG